MVGARRFNSNFIDVLTIILKWANPSGIALAITPVTKRIFLVAFCFISSFADFFSRGVDSRVAAGELGGWTVERLALVVGLLF